MLERAEPILKGLSLALAAILLFQFGRLVLRPDPLKNFNLPARPTWTAAPEVNTPTPGTNAPVPTIHAAVHGTGTNAPASSVRTNSPGPLPRPALVKKENDLSPAIQARIDRIKDSEVFGAAPRPMTLPMALLGIAGDDVFLRAPSGQTGLLRVGEQLGGVKLLRIGTNRVLVEHEGRKEELTIFAGFGSETLLPK